MRRATISLPDDLDEGVERFIRMQPARPSLTSVVQAALELYLHGGQHAAVAAGFVGRVLRLRPEIRRIVSEHGGSSPRLFGSTARGDVREGRDIDLLVDLEPGRTLFDLAAMRAELEAVLDAPVDVVSASGLDGDARDEILAEALTL